MTDVMNSTCPERERERERRERASVCIGGHVCVQVVRYTVTIIAAGIIKLWEYLWSFDVATVASGQPIPLHLL